MKHDWVEFLYHVVRDPENQNRVRWRNRAQHPKESCYYSRADSCVPSVHPRQVDNTGLVTLHFREQLDDCGFGRLFNKSARGEHDGIAQTYSRRITEDCREVKTLDMKSFKMVQDATTKI